jgi:hypothetical protein
MSSGGKFLQRCHVNRPINQGSVGFKKWGGPNDQRMVDRYSVTVKRDNMDMSRRPIPQMLTVR